MDAELLDHFGVYAVIAEAGRLLCVEKTRGPYTGLLDLPGGAPERDEDLVATLIREVHEELGVTPLEISAFRTGRLVHRRPGAPEFRHRYALSRVTLAQAPEPARSSADTGGVAWFDLHQGALSHLSPLARAGIELLQIGR